MNTTEYKIYTILKEIFDKKDRIIANGFYSDIESPKKYPLQLDFYIPKYNIAIEFQGPQHYKRNTSKIKRSVKDYAYYKKCDRIKNKKCKELDISLIVIKYTDKIDIKHIKSRIVRKGVKI